MEIYGNTPRLSTGKCWKALASIQPFHDRTPGARAEARGARAEHHASQWHTPKRSYQGTPSAKFLLIRILPAENIRFALKPRLSCDKVSESPDAALRLLLSPLDNLVFEIAEHYPLDSSPPDGYIVTDFPLHDRRHVNRYAHAYLFSSLSETWLLRFQPNSLDPLPCS